MKNNNYNVKIHKKNSLLFHGILNIVKKVKVVSDFTIKYKGEIKKIEKSLYFLK